MTHIDPSDMKDYELDAWLREHQSNVQPGDCWFPTKLMTDAWQVVEQLRKNGYWVDITSINHLIDAHRWQVIVNDDDLACHGPEGTGIHQTVNVKVLGTRVSRMICEAAWLVYHQRKDWEESKQ